jgi:hypothetical protein
MLDLSADYEVRMYRPGDEAGIVDLLGLVFGGWPHIDLDCSPLEHWRWKYLANPMGLLTVSVAISGGKVIGCFHNIPLKIKIGEDIFFCHVGADLAVHPDFRNVGVSKGLRDLCRETYPKKGIYYSYYSTGNPIMIESYRKSRPSFPHLVTNLVRIRDIDRQLREMPVKRHRLKKAGFLLASILNRVETTMAGGAPRGDFTITGSEMFDESVNAFWGEISNGYDFIVENRMDYLNWKYCKRGSGGGFVIRLAKQGDRVLGFSVLRINRFIRDYPVGYIVELLAVRERPDVVESLAADAVKYFDGEGVNLVNYQMIKDYPYGRSLSREGFLDSRVKIHLFYHYFMGVDKIKDIASSPPERVYFSWGNLDVLPVHMPGQGNE